MRKIISNAVEFARMMRPPPLARADQMVTSPTEWLWPGMIAAKRFVILMGEPGVGKSQIAMDLTARLTTGRAWPDGKQNRLIGSAAFLETEEEDTDTHHRAEAAGVDMRKLLISEEVFDFSDDAGIAMLNREADRMGDLRLIVLSPYRSFFGAKETNNEVEIRRRLTPIMAFIRERRIAVIGIGHKKPGTGGRSAEDMSGPQAYGRVVRSVMTVKFDQTDPAFKQNPKLARRVLVSAKTNNGGDGYGLAYSIVEHTCRNGEACSRIQWAGAAERPVPLLLEGPGGRAAAGAWLRDALASGARPAAEVLAMAQQRGIARATLYRARDDVGILSGKNGEVVTWALPNQ